MIHWPSLIQKTKSQASKLHKLTNNKVLWNPKDERKWFSAVQHSFMCTKVQLESTAKGTQAAWAHNNGNMLWSPQHCERFNSKRVNWNQCSMVRWQGNMGKSKTDKHETKWGKVKRKQISLKGRWIEPKQPQCARTTIISTVESCVAQHNGGTVGNRAPHKHLLCLAPTQEDWT